MFQWESLTPKLLSNKIFVCVSIGGVLKIAHLSYAQGALFMAICSHGNLQDPYCEGHFASKTMFEKLCFFFVLSGTLVLYFINYCFKCTLGTSGPVWGQLMTNTRRHDITF